MIELWFEWYFDMMAAKFILGIYLFKSRDLAVYLLVGAPKTRTLIQNGSQRDPYWIERDLWGRDNSSHRIARGFSRGTRVQHGVNGFPTQVEETLRAERRLPFFSGKLSFKLGVRPSNCKISAQKRIVVPL